jgi:hypothetical protein
LTWPGGRRLGALYWAVGHLLGPRVAERIGLPFLDCGILAGVAEQMHVWERAAEQLDAHTDTQRPLAGRPRGVSR